MSEYHYIDGTLRHGYFCSNCGQTVNMLATGHARTDFRRDDPVIWECEYNSDLVEKLRAANPESGTKPHFVRHAIAVRVE